MWWSKHIHIQGLHSREIKKEKETPLHKSVHLSFYLCNYVFIVSSIVLMMMVILLRSCLSEFSFGFAFFFFFSCGLCGFVAIQVEDSFSSFYMMLPTFLQILNINKPNITKEILPFDSKFQSITVCMCTHTSHSYQHLMISKL